MHGVGQSALESNNTEIWIITNYYYYYCYCHWYCCRKLTWMLHVQLTVDTEIQRRGW